LIIYSKPIFSQYLNEKNDARLTRVSNVFGQKRTTLGQKNNVAIYNSSGLLSASVKDDQTLGSLLVHDSVAALSASDSVSGSDLVFGVALAADVDYRMTDGAGGIRG
jgi:hypothetical protein